MLDRSSYFLCTKALPGPEPKAVFAERRLREAILWCEIEPGAIVTEDALVNRFGLARAATRAALARLAGEGLVQPIARRGWRIQAITGAQIGELIAARRFAEPALAEADLASGEIKRMRELACVIQAAAQHDDPQSAATARQYDRELLSLMAGRINTFQQRWLHDLWNHGERVTRFFEGGGSVRLAVLDPAPLVAAAASGDRAAIRTHRSAAIDTFERFVGQSLLAHPGELTAGSGKPAGSRPEGSRAMRIPSGGDSQKLAKRKGTYQ